MTQVTTWPAKKSDIGSVIDINRWASLFVDISRKTVIPIIPAAKLSIKAPIATPSVFDIGTLLDDRLRLRHPLVVKISKEKNSYIASCEKFEEFGYGDNPLEAVDDLRQTISELYWILKNEKNRLGSALKNLWNIVQSIIEER